MSSEAGHVQITEFSKEVIPMINWQMEDLFCQYGVAMPYFMLDFDFPDYSQRPDWVSGYNFNLDWGEWGYWLVWFNELLGLLFNEANLPRWQMPDLSPGSWAMYNSKMSELYDESAPEIFVHCYDYATSDYAIWSFSRNGSYLNKWTAPEWNQTNNICVDSSHNVYMTDIAGGAWNVIKKWCKSGTLLVTKTTDLTEGIAIGPDGYLYTSQLDGSDNVIVKRNLSDLTAVSQIDMASSSRQFTFDSDGYFYIMHSTEIEKWDYATETKIASHAIPLKYSYAYANGFIGVCLGGNLSTMPTALDEDLTDYDISSDISSMRHIAAIDNDFLVVGYNSGDKYYKLGKYTSAGTKIWLVNIEHTDNITVYGVAAYPF